MNWRRPDRPTRPRGAGPLYRALLALLAPLVPADRRTRWRREWEAEIAERRRRGPAPLAVRRRGVLVPALGAAIDAVRFFGEQWSRDLLWNDIRHGVRALWRHRAFTAGVVSTLALGIGATTSLFAVADALLLDPFPAVADSEGLVGFNVSYGDGCCFFFSHPTYLEAAERLTAFADVAAYNNAPLHLSVAGETQRVSGSLVTGNYFRALGLAASQGRLIGPEDDRHPGAHPVAVISHSLWRTRMAGDEAALGRPIVINGYPFTVIGVAPRGFHGLRLTRPVDVWLPAMMQPQAMPALGDVVAERRAFLGDFIGRVAAGVTREQVRADLDRTAANLATELPDVYTDLRFPATARPGLRPGQRQGVVDLMTLLFTVGGIVLLIASVNVASLVLARGAARLHEMSVRQSLGASRVRLVQQLSTEGALLAGAGGAGGLLVSRWSVDAAVRFLPTSEALDPSVLATSMDLRVLGFAIGVSLLTGLLFTVAPAFRISAARPAPRLRDASGSSSGGSLRATLVVAQVAACLVVLVGASLLVRTVRELYAVDPGFDTEPVVTASIDLGLQGYDSERATRFQRQILRALSTAPGVEAASLANLTPFGGSFRGTRFVVGGMELDQPLFAELNVVTPDHFHTLGIPLLRGRLLADTDVAGSAPVVVVSETLAERLGGDAVGMQIIPGSDPQGPGYEVVGVVSDASPRTLGDPPPLFLYFSLWQEPQQFMTLHVRSSLAPDAVLARVRRAVAALDPDLPIYGAGTIADQLDEMLREERTLAALLGAGGALALALSAVGLYGLLSWNVARRRREIGIRVALGARSSDLVRSIVRRGLALTAIGLLLGAAGGLVLGRLLAARLYGVSPTDPASFAAAGSILLLVALASSWVPARRASRVDPMLALRDR